MATDIWCTLGPASLNDRVIARLEELGVSLFRLNLSHTRVEDLPGILDFIRARTRVPVSLDTEGAQIRTAELAAGKVTVREGDLVRVLHERIAGDALAFNLHPLGIGRQLLVGDLLKIDAEVLAQVAEIETDGLVLNILQGGEIGQNKAVTVVDREIPMPVMTAKDRRALAIGREKGIRHVALSFANRASDLAEVRSLVAPGTHVTAKIECLNGLRNLAEIAEKADALLIDRGDLSREVGIERIPALQKEIIRRARNVGRNVHVATNLLESMIHAPSPTRAEVNDVFNTLVDGAAGLVLAAETAIGSFPVPAVHMLKKLISEFERNRASDGAWPMSLYADSPGEPVQPPTRVTRALQVTDTDLMECAQIARGVYAPLPGFMGSRELQSVLDGNRLLDGSVWTVPIVLRVEEAAVSQVSVGDRLSLTDAGGHAWADLEVSELYAFDLEVLAAKWFGTTSREHPAVRDLMQGGKIFVAGRVSLLEDMMPYGQYALSPWQTRAIFAQKGWTRVVGMNAEDRSPRWEELLGAVDLGKIHADGMFVGLPIRPGNAGLDQPPAGLEWRGALPQVAAGKIVQGSSGVVSRGNGPREAVFQALCYRNLGCSHWLMTLPNGGTEGETARTRELFETLGDIGIAPLFLDLSVRT
jgi:pyruvate kinase